MMQNKMNVATKTMILSAITNVFVVILKMFFGFIYGSITLIADSLHTSTDLITDLVAIVGEKISEKRSNKTHPFGYGLMEYVTSAIIGLVVFALGVIVIAEAWFKEMTIPSKVVIYVSLIAMAVKYIVSEIMIRRGERERSSLIIASGLESRSDAESTSIVIIATILMQFSDKIEILKYSDIVGTIIIGILIIKTAITLLTKSVSMILGEVETDEEVIKTIEDIIIEEVKVKKVDKIIVLKYGPYYKINAKIEMDENLTLKQAHKKIKEVIYHIKRKNKKYKYVDIEIWPEDRKK